MWHFRAKMPGEPNRESVQAEFFTTGSISDPGMALVREGIQNSLDASRDGEQVLVRILLSGSERAVGADAAAEYFENAWEHLQAPASGLRPDLLPSPDEPCPFIAFEDFGTSGLEGDPTEPYHFFRAEGQSDKGSSDRGIWGVGKHVFLRSSRISAVFGLTVRNQDQRKLLMGKTVLKSHYLEEGGRDECYQDGYFGSKPEDSELVLPLERCNLIDDFSRLFDLQRGSEPGLSIIVPWPDEQIDETALVRAVLRGYFYPILAGQLQVIVETSGFQEILQADSLIQVTERIGDEISADMRPLVELADWARQLQDDERVSLQMPDPSCGWHWSEDLFPDGLIEMLHDQYVNGARIAVRIPVTVRQRDGDPQVSFFDVYLQRDPSEQTGRPTFVREGIIIPNVDAPRSRGVRALVVAEHRPIASFLRDAENPAHTEWQHDGTNFKEKYRSGVGDLTFVKRSIHEIVRVVTAAEEQEDPTLLADFFSLPAEPEDQETSSTRQEGAGESAGQGEEPRPAPPPPRPRGFRIQRVQGGFSVLPSEDGAQPPRQLDIRVAYNVRRGSPLKRYSPADFELDKQPVQLESEGLRLDECSENRMLVTVEDRNFGLHVTGFDERRDLYVRAVRVGDSEEEEGNGGTET